MRITCYVPEVDEATRTELLTRFRRVQDLEEQLAQARIHRDEYYVELIESGTAGASEIARVLDINRVVVQRVKDSWQRAQQMVYRPGEARNSQ